MGFQPFLRRPVVVGHHHPGPTAFKARGGPVDCATLVPPAITIVIQLLEMLLSLEEARQTAERLGLPLPSPLPGA